MTIYKKIILFFISLLWVSQTYAQDANAKKLLDDVSTKMSSYKNMSIAFTSTLTNEDAGIKEGDEPPIIGDIVLSGEKYKLNYLRNTLLFDGEKLVVINHDEKEININEGDLDASDGIIYPSKLFTFYKEGYTYTMGKKTTIKGKEIQYVNLTPIDSSSEIVSVTLAIETKTKHIYQLIQLGANASKTTLTVTSFKSNLSSQNNIFSLDKAEFLKKGYIID